MILLTTLYETKNKKRDDELLDCLTRNIHNPAIKYITVLYEGEDGYVFRRIPQSVRVIKIYRRPTYDDFFLIANIFHTDSKIIIANSDIYFKGGLENLNKVDMRNKLICLTRYHRNGNKLTIQSNKKSTACADAWVFETPTKLRCHCKLGIAYCDGKVSHYAHKDGFDVVNYSKDVVTIHVHNNEYINSERSVRDYLGKSLYVEVRGIKDKETIKPYLKDD